MATDELFGVRTYKRRAGRVTGTQGEALARLWPSYGVEVSDAPLDLSATFGRVAPLVLEVGFGMGTATAELARRQPDLDVLAVDVHTPGVGNLLKLVDAGSLTNVRVATGDARDVLVAMLEPGSLHAVRVFFPDPWPKARHAKRRLVTRAFADLVADRLALGGHLHVATDDAAYAGSVRALLEAHPALDASAEVPWRPATKFEARAVGAGRQVHDLVAVRVARDISG